MRRFLLTLTVLSISGWSQPLQQQAQPPIVVKVEMPPTNVWVHLVELIVPGIPLSPSWAFGGRVECRRECRKPATCL